MNGRECGDWGILHRRGWMSAEGEGTGESLTTERTEFLRWHLRMDVPSHQRMRPKKACHSIALGERRPLLKFQCHRVCGGFLVPDRPLGAGRLPGDLRPMPGGP